MGDILEIRLDPPVTECINCGDECLKEQGLPMYEGEILPPDDTTSEWAGFDCCKTCFALWTVGDMQTLRERESD
jgi:hypothetical protein